jgi:hypothetical protein
MPALGEDAITPVAEREREVRARGGGCRGGWDFGDGLEKG